MDQKPIITAKHLSVTYFAGRSNEVRALRDINLEIFPGEYIIFFGPSGCGKSTLLYSIAGLEHNIQGDILVSELNLKQLSEHRMTEEQAVDGYNLRQMTQRQFEEYYQHAIGMIFQAFYLIPSLSVVENVAVPQMAIKENKRVRRERALTLLKRFGLESQAFKLPTDLSGGQQQRVAISRALINDASIIVADEPVGNLDSTSSAEVMKVLRELNDKQKKTVILVTHDPSHLHHAHRIFYLRDGVITGTKVNTEEERKESLVEAASRAMSSSLSHWAKTLPANTPEARDHELIKRQAEQVIAEVFNGMTIDEMHELFDRVESLITHSQHDVQPLIGFLHHSAKDGGIGMNILKAQKIAEDIQKVTTEMWNLRARVHAASAGMTMPDGREISDVRKTLLDSLNISLPSEQAVLVLDKAIADHLTGRLDRMGVQRILDQSEKEGGAGLDARVARKIARRLELFVIPPKNQNTVPPASPPTP